VLVAINMLEFHRSLHGTYARIPCRQDDKWPIPTIRTLVNRHETRAAPGRKRIKSPTLGLATGDASKKAPGIRLGLDVPWSRPVRRLDAARETCEPDQNL